MSRFDLKQLNPNNLWLKHLSYRHSRIQVDDTQLQKKHEVSLLEYFHNYFISHKDSSQFKSSCIKEDEGIFFLKLLILLPDLILQTTELPHVHVLWLKHMTGMDSRA